MSTAILQADSEQRSAAPSPSRDGRAFRVVHIVLGLLLVTAAGLKLYGLNVTALPRVGWFATPQVQVATAEWELVLGLWLLSGAAQQLAWLAALGTFTGFASVSAYFSVGSAWPAAAVSERFVRVRGRRLGSISQR